MVGELLHASLAFQRILKRRFYSSGQRYSYTGHPFNPRCEVIYVFLLPAFEVHTESGAFPVASLNSFPFC